MANSAANVLPSIMVNFVQNIQMAAVGNSSAAECSAGFRPLFLQRVCHSAMTVRDKLGFSFRRPTVAGV